MMSQERQLRSKHLLGDGGQSKNVKEMADANNTTKENMEGGRRTRQRKRELSDTPSVVIRRIDVYGTSELSDSSEEVQVCNLKLTPSPTEIDKDLEDKPPAKKRRITRKSVTKAKTSKKSQKKSVKKKKKEEEEAPIRRPLTRSTKTKKLSLKGSGGKLEVEKILKVKVLKNGAKEFLIHWKGFSEEFDTWESESNLDCIELINQYFAEHKEVIVVTEEEEEESNRARMGRRTSSRLSGLRKAKVQAIEENKGNKGTKVGAKKQSRNKGKKERSKGKKSRPASARAKKSAGGKAKQTEDGKKKKTAEGKDEKTLENLKSSSPAAEKDDTESVDQEEFEVDRIVDLRELPGGTREFLIKWKGFGKKYNTWEPENHLNCSEKLEKFLKGLEESFTERQLRVNRKKTSRFAVECETSGRKCSKRLGKLPRKSYSEMEYNY